MCNYCGCREFPLIGRLTAEHVTIEETAGLLRRAVIEGRHAGARGLLDRLVALLEPHTAVEEDGLFRELRAEGTLVEGVDRLCAEHAEIHLGLNGVDRAAPDWSGVLATLRTLHRHIDNEEHGLFPAAAIALPMTAWDRITPIDPVPVADSPLS